MQRSPRKGFDDLEDASCVIRLTVQEIAVKLVPRRVIRLTPSTTETVCMQFTERFDWPEVAACLGKPEPTRPPRAGPLERYE